MREIHSILESLAHVESTFSSIQSITEECNEAKKQITNIQNAIKNCETLCNINIELHTHVQCQIAEIKSNIQDTLKENKINTMKDDRKSHDKNAGYSSGKKINPFQSKQTNKFISPISKNNRFTSEINRIEYTKKIEVHIDNASILNIDVFINEFTREFEKCLGKNTISKVVVLKYQMDKTKINNILIALMFNVPFAYSLLNEMTFPSNWTFFAYTGQKHNRLKNQDMNKGILVNKVNNAKRQMKQATHGQARAYKNTHNSGGYMNAQHNHMQHIYTQHSGNMHNNIHDAIHNNTHSGGEYRMNNKTHGIIHRRQSQNTHQYITTV